MTPKKHLYLAVFLTGTSFIMLILIITLFFMSGKKGKEVTLFMIPFVSLILLIYLIVLHNCLKLHHKKIDKLPPFLSNEIDKKTLKLLVIIYFLVIITDIISVLINDINLMLIFTVIYTITFIIILKPSLNKNKYNNK